MKHIVKYEWFNWANDQGGRKPWVARIEGLDLKYKYKRNFVEGKIDFSEANSKGSRGVYLYFLVEEGQLYEVFYKTSWQKSVKKFCVWLDGKEVPLTAKEIPQWLKFSLA